MSIGVDAKDVFINQERKLGDQRRSDTILVLTINFDDSGLGAYTQKLMNI